MPRCLSLLALVTPQFAITNALREFAYTEHLAVSNESTASRQKERVSRGCGVRVFTDVDDTMVCSAGSLLHGIDSNCEQKGVLYPGFAAFYWWLSSGPGSCAAPPLVVPLSARPAELGSWVAMKPTDAVYVELARGPGPHARGEAWSLDLANAIYGSISTGHSVGNHMYEDSLSLNKYNGWKDFPHDTPSIFVGDNGQGDVYAAELMGESSANGGPKIFASFMHHVQFWASPNSPDLKTSRFSDRPGNAAHLLRKRIFLFQNYGEAACIAYKSGLIPGGGYIEVMQSIENTCANSNFETKECAPYLPEFKLMGRGNQEYVVIGMPDACDQPRQVPNVPNNFQWLTSMLTWAGGQPSVGLCSNINPELLAEIGRARDTIQKLSASLPVGDQVNKHDFFSQYGVSPIVLNAFRKGFHCVTDCDYSCKHVRKAWSFGGSVIQGTGIRLDKSCGETLVYNLIKRLSVSPHSGRKVCRIAPS